VIELKPVTLEHGERFDRLIVLSPSYRKRREYLCGCSCGKKCYATLNQLMKGRKKSCPRCIRSSFTGRTDLKR
jgi:hypothetical protein